MANLSKNKIRQCGEHIRQKEDFDSELLFLWRNAHLPMMAKMATLIRKHLNEAHLKEEIVARRLKRFYSIFCKLQRFPNMKLNTMQDIAGIRVVFKNVKNVEKFSKIMSEKYQKNNRQFKYINQKNYIENPKNDGYRSIHQIFKYKNENDFKMFLELQIRTQLQHYWATAVEVLGMKNDNKIKEGNGKTDEKEFFELSSALFSFVEGTAILNNYKNFSKTEIIEKIKNLNDKNKILENLLKLLISNKNIDDRTDDKDYYFIILIDLKKNKSRLFGFKKEDFLDAQKLYDFFEQEFQKTGEKDAVFISLDKHQLLKKAYPNYFLNGLEFIAQIKKECKL